MAVEEEAGMAQLEDDIGCYVKLKDVAWTTTPSSASTTDNGTELFTWPDGALPPFAQCKCTIMEGGFRRAGNPALAPVIPRTPSERHLLRLGLVPTFVAAAGNRTSPTSCLRGVKLGDRDLQEHLDAITRWTPSTGKGHRNRHEIFYLGESSDRAVAD